MHFGHFGSVDRFEPTKCIFCYRLPTELKLWTDSNRHTPFDAFPKSFPLKIYLQSRRCKGILDRFEPPHRLETVSNGKYKTTLFFQWTDPNYRKPNTDLLKTKKKPRQQNRGKFYSLSSPRQTGNWLIQIFDFLLIIPCLQRLWSAVFHR